MTKPGDAQQMLAESEPVFIPEQELALCWVSWKESIINNNNERDGGLQNKQKKSALLLLAIIVS